MIASLPPIVRLECIHRQLVLLPYGSPSSPSLGTHPAALRTQSHQQACKGMWYDESLDQYSNRTVHEVALYEHLAVLGGGPPNEYHFAVYSEWGRSNWGMVFTGNVQVADDHLTFGRDLTLPKDLSDESLEPYRRLAALMQGRAPGAPLTESEHPLAIAQLNHTGRQSMNFVGGRVMSAPLGVSPIRVGDSFSNLSAFQAAFHKVAFATPKEMTAEQVEHVISRFAYGAQALHKAGFDGVEIHAAHGCRHPFLAAHTHVLTHF
jgi:2,4-dienoyl-CoA reductase-like NADH-dependent reductase (Old Yellow Enzyme family)